MPVLAMMFFLCWSAVAVAGSSITLQGDLLSVDLDDMPVAEVIARLKRLRVGVGVSGYVVADPTETISVRFEDLPLPLAMQRLFRHQDHLLRFQRDPGEEAGFHLSLRGGTAPVEIPDPEILLESLQTHYEAGDLASLLPALEDAATHPASEVRERVIALLARIDEHAPVALLGRLALDDPEPALRTRALLLLVDRHGEEALAVLEQALEDPDPGVVSQVRMLLDRFL